MPNVPFQTEQEAAEGRREEAEGTQKAGAATREGEEEARRAESKEQGQMPEKSQGTCTSSPHTVHVHIYVNTVKVV